MAKGLLVGLAAIALVVLAVGGGLYATLAQGNSPEGVVKKYYKAYDRGDCEKAAGYWDLGRNREAYLVYCEGVSGTINVESLTIDRVEREKGRAEVFYTTVTEQNGVSETSETSLLLVDDDGTWRIHPRGRYG